MNWDHPCWIGNQIPIGHLSGDIIIIPCAGQQLSSLAIKMSVLVVLQREL